MGCSCYSDLHDFNQDYPNSFRRHRRIKRFESFFLLFVLFFVSCSFLGNIPVKADNTNLAPIPTGWSTFQRSLYPEGGYDYISQEDYSIYYSSVPSIRSEPIVDADSSDRWVNINGWNINLAETCPTRETNSYWIHIHPGDHIVFSAWIKTGASGGQPPSNPSYPLYGASLIGLDWYGETLLGGIYDESLWVMWNRDWTKVTLDIIVPQTITHYITGIPEAPSGVILWMGTERDNSGYAWYSDVEFYINPTGGPTPTPTLEPGEPTPVPTIPGGYVPVTSAEIPPIIYDPFYHGIKDVALGSGFQIYCNTTHKTLAFSSELVNSTFQIEVLTGVWNGTDVFMGITNRGGYLLFDSNSAAEIQVSHNNEKNVRLEYQNLAFSTLTPGHSWNGTIPDDTQDCYLRWSFPLDLPWEEDFMLWIGLFGLILMISGLLLGAYSFKHYPIFSFTKETIWETSLLIYSFCAVFIGFGLVMTWLLS